MRALEAGDVELAKKNAASNTASLPPHVREGRKVLAINSTCSYMHKKEYGEVAAASVAPGELPWRKKMEGKLNRGIRSSPGRVAYHARRRLKAQNIGFRSRDRVPFIAGA